MAFFDIKLLLILTTGHSITDLVNQVQDFNNEIQKRNNKIVHLNQENQYLKEQLEWFKRQIFGIRSERVVSDLNARQLYLEGFENLETKKEEKKSIPAHERKVPNRSEQDKITLPDDLPVETTVLDIPDDQKICQETGEALVQIGVEVSHKLAHKPGS